MARLDKEHSGVMDNEGESVRARRTALGMSQEDLAREAGVNRDTVGAIENGLGFRRSSLTKIERALSRIEEEAGMNAPAAQSPIQASPELFRFIVKDPHGLEIVTVEGPMTNADELRRQAISIIREIRGESDDAEGDNEGEQGS